jgi:hypothetical protein
MVALALALLVPLSHLEIQASDDSWLLLVDGRPVDVAGYLSDRSTQLVRDCRQVQVLQPTDPWHADALRAIRHESPPDSLSAQLVHLTRQDAWLLAQVKFSDLQAAVVVLTASERGLTMAQGAVWSGTTQPHRPDPFIRRYLRSRVPAAPADLIACFESRA